MHLDRLAARLTAALSLDSTPVALTFVDAEPADVPVSHPTVPSSCAFWRAAEQSTFYAPAEAHFHCPVGAMVMGFGLPQPVSDELDALMTKMCDCGYLDPAEAANVPGRPNQPTGIIYGPLREHPRLPSVVLLWLSPRQAMVCNEAVGAASWSEPGPHVTGRPACAAIPLAGKTDAPVTSYGCAGMRTFTEIGDDRMLFVVPGSRLEDVTSAVVTASELNHAMDDFYRERKAELAHTSPAIGN